MINPRIECLLFEARTLDGDAPVHLRFHHITRIDTTQNRFLLDDGLNPPTPCRYDSLRLLEPAEALELRLRAELAA